MERARFQCKWEITSWRALPAGTITTSVTRRAGQIPSLMRAPLIGVRLASNSVLRHIVQTTPQWVAWSWLCQAKNLGGSKTRRCQTPYRAKPNGLQGKVISDAGRKTSLSGSLPGSLFRSFSTESSVPPIFRSKSSTRSPRRTSVVSCQSL